MSTQVKVKFRRSAALAVAAGITVIGAVPLLAESVWFLAVLLIPLAIAVWAWRAGTDVDERGFTVRALLGRREVPWAAVDGLVTDGRVVQARLANGHLVLLDAVRPADLPRVIKASGQDLQTDRDSDEPDAGEAEPADIEAAEIERGELERDGIERDRIERDRIERSEAGRTEGERTEAATG